MIEPNEYAKRLAAQGEETDMVQHMALSMAYDPIYPHLATLATAGAMTGIDWDIKSPFRGSDKLVARRSTIKGTSLERPSVIERHLSRSIQLGDASLVGSVEVEYASDPNLVLPKSFDESLSTWGLRGVHTSSSNDNDHLAQSSLTIERPGNVFGSPTLRVGILATHMTRGSMVKPNVTKVCAIPDPSGYQPLFNILNRVTDLDFDEDGGYSTGSMRTRTRSGVATAITTDPSAHFAFHEALGVPQDIIDRGRKNFGVFTRFLDLPYTLPEPMQAPQDR